MGERRDAFFHTAAIGRGYSSRLGAGLRELYHSGILMCMRTTLNIDERILRRAADITGVKEKASLVRMGLEALAGRS